jgi:SH3-like domain-containing protein
VKGLTGRVRLDLGEVMQPMRRRGGFLILSLLALLALLLPAPAAAARDQSGLPVPRYVSLRSNQINLRSGPGMNFPIEWVYQRKHLPVEIIAEYDTWRKIRDWQGTVGWVHQSMLDGSRYVMITGSERLMHQDAADTSPVTARLEPGVIPSLLKCQADWCRVEVQGYKGWLKRDQLYGVYATEKVE